MYLFIISHLGSGSSNLCQSLYNHPYMSWKSIISYDSPADLLSMKQEKRKKIFFDQILFNHLFNHKLLEPFCRFIYVIREPKPSISFIVKEYKYTIENACDYYCFRLRRIYEMVKKCNNPSLLLTWEQLSKKETYEKITDFLQIGKQVEWNFINKKEDYLSIPKSVEERYEHYYKLLTDLKTL